MQTTYGTQLSSKYVDDYFAACTYDGAVSEIDCLTLDASQRCGADAVSDSKTIISETPTILGYFWNTTTHTVSISESIFRKVLRLFFVHTVAQPQLNDHIPTTHLQRLGSYAIRLSHCLTCLLPFSRGFHYATRFTNTRNSHSKWTSRALSDLAVWRTVLAMSLSDFRWLFVSMHTVGILRYLPSDGIDPILREHNRARRQASAASLVGFGDACTTNNGLGVYIEHFYWSSATISALQSNQSSLSDQRPVDINVLEFIAALLTSMALIQSLDSLPPSTPRHIHIWTDNTSCLSWMKRHKADHPLHLFLLYCLVFLQVHHRVLITFGHIPGFLNIYADAASRNFQCPNGPALHDHLHTLPHWTPPSCFMNAIVSMSMTSSPDICVTLRETLTALDIATFSSSVNSTTLPQIFQQLGSRPVTMPSTSPSISIRAAPSVLPLSTAIYPMSVPASLSRTSSLTLPPSVPNDLASCYKPSVASILSTVQSGYGNESPPCTSSLPKPFLSLHKSLHLIPPSALPSKLHSPSVTAFPFVPRNIYFAPVPTHHTLPPN